jgi:hypothetical protein
MNKAPTFTVLVGSVGNVYHGPDEALARMDYEDCCTLSRMNHGRMAGETITLCKDGEPIREYIGSNDKDAK